MGYNFLISQHRAKNEDAVGFSRLLFMRIHVKIMPGCENEKISSEAKVKIMLKSTDFPS